MHSLISLHALPQSVLPTIYALIQKLPPSTQCEKREHHPSAVFHTSSLSKTFRYGMLTELPYRMTYMRMFISRRFFSSLFYPVLNGFAFKLLSEKLFDFSLYSHGNAVSCRMKILKILGLWRVQSSHILDRKTLNCIYNG